MSAKAPSIKSKRSLTYGDGTIQAGDDDEQRDLEMQQMQQQLSRNQGDFHTLDDLPGGVKHSSSQPNIGVMRESS